MGLKLRRERTLKMDMKIQELSISWGGWKLADSVNCPWKAIELKRLKDTTERNYISDVSIKRGASAKDSRKQGKGEAEESSGELVTLRQCLSVYERPLFV